MAWLKRNWFLVALGVAVLLAVLKPEWGMKGGFLQTQWTTKAVIFMIFMIQGLCLPTEDILQGCKRWRFHVPVLVYIFGANTLLALCVVELFGDLFDANILIGLLFVGALPTTISTALVYATRAGGRVMETLFNLTVSNVMAIFLVPAWMLWVTRGATDMLDPVPMLIKIASLILLPLILGQVLRPFVHPWIDRSKRPLGNVNSAGIAFIVFASFSQSVMSGLWETQDVRTISLLAVVVVGMLLLTQLCLLGAAHLLKLDRADRISIFFTCSFKSLAAGVPMAGSIFSTHPEMLGGVLLPLLFYSISQLSLGGLWADYWEKRRP